MRRFMTVVLIVGAVLALVAGVWFGVDARAKQTLRRQQTRWRKEVSRETRRALAHTMPVLSGTPREGNAAEEERTILRALSEATSLDLGDLKKGAESPPGPLSKQARALLDAGRAHLAALERALTATGCDWELDYEDALNAEVPPILGASRLARLAVLAGHERAAANDPAAAVDWYLRAVRLGADLGQGPLIHAMVGTVAVRAGLRAVGQLVATRPRGMALEDISRALDALEPVLPAPHPALERERLTSLGMCFQAARTGAMDPTDLAVLSGSASRSLARLVRTLLVPPRRTFARAVPELDAGFDTMQKGVAAGSRGEQDRLVRRWEAQVATSKNEVVAVMLPNLVRAAQKLQANSVHLALCRLAITLERRRREDGRYPQTLDEADRPIDTWARPARLHYQPSPDGKTYRIWSAGPNGKDERGRSKEPADDVLLEGRAPAG